MLCARLQLFFKNLKQVGLPPKTNSLSTERYCTKLCCYFSAGSQKDVQQQYVLGTTMMTWPVARDYCRTTYTDLVSVRNENESLIIQEVAAGLQVWTGLFRDPWIWSDQTYSSFRYWKPGQSVWTDSSVTCGALLKSQSGKWGEVLCDEAHPFLCSCE